MSTTIDTSTPQRFVRNQTPKRLVIKGRDGKQLILAPLEKRCLDQDATTETPFDETSFTDELAKLEQCNYVRITKEEKKTTNLDWIPGAAPMVLIGLPMVMAVIKDKTGITLYWWSWLIAFALVAVPLAVVVYVSSKGQQAARLTAAQMLSLSCTLAIGIGLPLAVIFYFGGGRELIGVPSLPLLGRVLQFVFIATASLLPALLYFLFDRQQLGTLRERFDQQIFRLDPNVKTLVDVRAKYRRQLDEIYGPEMIAESGRLISGTRWPILVATMVITFGWILTLLPAGSTPAINNPDDLLNLFKPRPTALVFGFLGAYFFALHTVARRYTRADLKPKAYTSITVRVFIVIILAWVIELSVGDTNKYALMFVFVVGLFPETGLTYIQEMLREPGRLLTKFIPYPKEKHPLTNLVGIDLYDRARLLDEGVTNIESLAHHDLIDLMLETRIPVPRLVDWVDQAILYLHLTVNDAETSPVDNDESHLAFDATKPGAAAATTNATQSQPPHADETGKVQQKVANEKKEKNGSKADAVIALRQCLREYGIRTATDLIKAAGDGGCLCEILEQQDKDNLNRIKVILKTLEDDEWLSYINHWREDIKIEEEIIPAPAASKTGTGVAGNGHCILSDTPTTLFFVEAERNTNPPVTSMAG